MGYNWAKVKMKKRLFFIALSVLMSVGFAKVAMATQHDETNQPSSITIDSEGCISGIFVAEEDGHVVGTITLNSNCTFKLVDPTDGYVTTTTGSYSIDGDLRRGQMADLTFYVDGRSAGTVTIAWPENEGICIYMNGYVFRKQ